MGIFTRFKDIVGSNISAMLDKAEDPEKMIRLMIREMEETLIELKSGCAATMAEATKFSRRVVEAEDKVALWTARAELAVDKGRDDLAREALVERRRFEDQLAALNGQQAGMEELVVQAQNDIGLLEEKLQAAKEKQRLLVERHHRAESKMRAQKDIRKAGDVDAMVRFERMEQRIERMEADADLVNPPRRKGGGDTLEDRFAQLEGGDAIEAELARIKADRTEAPAAESKGGKK